MHTPCRKATILCVEDDLIPLTLRKLALEKAGYSVISAASAQEALRLSETHTFDLLLSDYMMPGMNGAELVRKIRERHPDIPCLLYSGVADLSPDLSVADRFFSKLEGIERVIGEIDGMLQE